jgi:hypothetical protein
MVRRKSYKRNLGDILKIDLGENFHSYCHTLGDASYAFYEGRFDEDQKIDQIIHLPILFKIAVMDYAVKFGRWAIVGNSPLPESLAHLPAKFIQDKIDKRQFRIYENGEIRRATRDECIGLESAAAWDPEHVEDRLRDHFAGRENKWVKSLEMTA